MFSDNVALNTFFSAGFLLLLTLPMVLLSKQPILRLRWASWLGIAIVVGLSYIGGSHSMFALALCCSTIMWYEFARLITVSKRYAMLSTILVVLSSCALYSYDDLTLCPWWLAVLLVWPIYKAEGARFQVAFTFATAICLLVWGFLQITLAPTAAIALVFCLAVFDVSGWVGGTFLGKGKILGSKIFGTISPNKTLAGLLASAPMGAAALYAVGALRPESFALLTALAIAGDWLESAFKRWLRTKDVSDWLPGFGGLLDRFDSMLLLAPIAALIIGVN